MQRTLTILGLLVLAAVLISVLHIGGSATTTQATSNTHTLVPSTPVVHSTGTHPILNRVTRINQLDPAQYTSTQEYDEWSYSACSAAALAEVFNAYGYHYRVTDVLSVEDKIGAITTRYGLMGDMWIARTATHFGFVTNWGYQRSLTQVIASATRGTPVIVSFPPARYSGGHLLIVTGGNAAMVLLADSSRYNRLQLTRTQFLAWWGGFSAIVTPVATKGGQV